MGSRKHGFNYLVSVDFTQSPPIQTLTLWAPNDVGRQVVKIPNLPHCFMGESEPELRLWKIKEGEFEFPVNQFTQLPLKLLMEKDSYYLQNPYPLFLAFQEHRLQHPSWRCLLQLLHGTWMLGILRKGKQRKRESIMMSLYGSMVYLEYCVQFWSSQFRKDMAELKETQPRWSIKWKEEMS